MREGDLYSAIEKRSSHEEYQLICIDVKVVLLEGYIRNILKDVDNDTVSDL